MCFWDPKTVYVKAVLFLDVFNFLKKMFQVAILVNINVILVNVLTTLLFVIKLWTVPMITQMRETVLPQVRLSIMISILKYSSNQITSHSYRCSIFLSLFWCLKKRWCSKKCQCKHKTVMFSTLNSLFVKYLNYKT